MPYKRIEPKKWPARDEVRALARQHTVEAMDRLIELMGARSQFVAMNAARTVLMQGLPQPSRKPRFRRVGPRGVNEVNVTITKFSKEKKRGAERGDSGLPVVPGRRKGPRHAGDAGGAGLPALRRQRKGVRRGKGLDDGAETDLPGSGTETRPGGGAATAGTDRGAAPGKTRSRQAR